MVFNKYLGQRSNSFRGNHCLHQGLYGNQCSTQGCYFNPL